MDNSALEVIIGSILGSGVLSTIIVALSQRGKNKADEAKAISEAVGNLIEPLNRRLKELEDDQCEKDKTIANLQKEVADLKESNAAKGDEITKLRNKVVSRDGRISVLEKSLILLQNELAAQLIENSRLQRVNAEKNDHSSTQDSPPPDL